MPTLSAAFLFTLTHSKTPVSMLPPLFSERVLEDNISVLVSRVDTATSRTPASSCRFMLNRAGRPLRYILSIEVSCVSSMPYFLCLP